MWQDDAAQSHRRFDPNRRWSHRSERQARDRSWPRKGRCVSEFRSAPMGRRADERDLWIEAAKSSEGRARRNRNEVRKAGGARWVREAVAKGAVGRHAATRG